MSLDFYYSFGFRNSNKNLAFYDENVVLFATGKFCVLFDLDTESQKLFQFTDRAEVSALTKCGVLVAGAIRGKPPSVCVFNTLSETKKFYLAPISITCTEITCLSISVNLKFVAAQGGHPDWLLVIWLSQTREVVTTFHPAGNPENSVWDISFHAGDRDELVVVGSGVFKLYEYQEENMENEKPPFDEHVFEKLEKTHNFYTIGWPEKENLAVGTSNGKILFFRGIELVDEISITDDAKDYLDGEANDKHVTSIVVTAQHLVCVYGGLVALVYSGEEIGRYRLAKSVLLPPRRPTRNIPGETMEESDYLINIQVNPDGKNLIATTRDGQMLLCRGFTEGNEVQHFTTLLHRQHNDSVIGMDVARGRPIVATFSRNVAILWNYVNKTQELRKIFKYEMTDIAMHPTGLFVAVGFEKCCRIFNILYGGFGEREYIECKSCHGVGFSSGGHLLAIVSGSVIEIYSFMSLSLLFKLDGHAGVVSSFDWSMNDTRLVSCDVRGVICEWDLVSRCKNWEITAMLAYLTVSTNPPTGNLIAVGSDNSIRCFHKSSLKWKMNCDKELTYAVFCLSGKAFRVGTTDGCIEVYSFPENTENILTYVHSGMVTGLKYNSKYDILVSCGTDGSVFLWKTSEWSGSETDSILSSLCLVNNANLMKQKNALKQVCLSLQHTDTARDCEFEFSCVKHEKDLRTMALEHEQKVNNLNVKIIRIKEEMQNILFDSDPKEDRKELELAVRREIIDTTFKLNESYKKSNTYANETNNIILKYESIIDSLSENHAKLSCLESTAIEEITGKIKALEDILILEKAITRRALSMSEECKKKAEKGLFEETSTLRSSQKALLGEQEAQSIRLEHEIKRLEELTAFKARDTKNRRNITSGQVDYDIREKTDAITLLKMDFQKLESVLESKEKITQTQEKKFCEMRKLVGNFQKHHSVSKTAIEELVEDVYSKVSEIELCRQEIKKIANTIPNIQEEIEGIEDLCSTVTEKLGDTVEGYQRKEKDLRETQEVISKYTSMLHLCVKRDCDPIKLVQDIMSLFESSRTGFVQETADSSLLDEYESQIDKLKRSYDLIKREPSKALRNKSIAEFRLSQDNSKILREVQEIQIDAESLRLIINEIEMALGLHVVKSNKKADDLRNKIEFVIDASKRNREVKVREISRLDAFIEEQQKDIVRFQTLVAGKLEK